MGETNNSQSELRDFPFSNLKLRTLTKDNKISFYKKNFNK